MPRAVAATAVAAAWGAGGAIFNQGSLALDGVTLTDNIAQGGASGDSSVGNGGGGSGEFSTDGNGGGFGGGFQSRRSQYWWADVWVRGWWWRRRWAWLVRLAAIPLLTRLATEVV